MMYSHCCKGCQKPLFNNDAAYCSDECKPYQLLFTNGLYSGGFAADQWVVLPKGHPLIKEVEDEWGQTPVTGHHTEEEAVRQATAKFGVGFGVSPKSRISIEDLEEMLTPF